MSDAENSPFEDEAVANAVADFSDEMPENLTPLDRDRYRLQEMDRDIRETEILLARKKEIRRSFYAEHKKTERRPSLTEMNAKAQSIGRVEQRRKVRVVEELSKLTGSMNMGERPSHPLLHPSLQEAARVAAAKKES